MKHDDGGPAWPHRYHELVQNEDDSEFLHEVTGPGMSWLDYAAIQIAAGLCAGDWHSDRCSTAERAYSLAEDLLSEKRIREEKCDETQT